MFFSAPGSGNYAGAARVTAIIYIALTAIVAALVALIAARERGVPGRATVHRDRPASLAVGDATDAGRR